MLATYSIWDLGLLMIGDKWYSGSFPTWCYLGLDRNIMWFGLGLLWETPIPSGLKLWNWSDWFSADKFIQQDFWHKNFTHPLLFCVFYVFMIVFHLFSENFHLPPFCILTSNFSTYPDTRKMLDTPFLHRGTQLQATTIEFDLSLDLWPWPWPWNSRPC